MSLALEKAKKREEAARERLEKARKARLRLENRAAAVERKRRTRRLILLGALIEGTMEANAWPTMPPRQALDASLTRADDRALFGLSPAPATSQNAPESL